MKEEEEEERKERKSKKVEVHSFLMRQFNQLH